MHFVIPNYTRLNFVSNELLDYIKTKSNYVLSFVGDERLYSYSRSLFKRNVYWVPWSRQCVNPDRRIPRDREKKKEEKLQPMNAMIQLYNTRQGQEARLDLEAEASHAGLILLDHRLALLRGIVGFGE